LSADSFRVGWVSVHTRCPKGGENVLVAISGNAAGVIFFGAVASSSEGFLLRLLCSLKSSGASTSSGLRVLLSSACVRHTGESCL
jgi:hypothetical protein